MAQEWFIRKAALSSPWKWVFVLCLSSRTTLETLSIQLKGQQPLLDASTSREINRLREFNQHSKDPTRPDLISYRSPCARLALISRREHLIDLGLVVMAAAAVEEIMRPLSQRHRPSIAKAVVVGGHRTCAARCKGTEEEGGEKKREIELCLCHLLLLKPRWISGHLRCDAVPN